MRVFKFNLFVCYLLSFLIGFASCILKLCVQIVNHLGLLYPLGEFSVLAFCSIYF